MSVHRRVLPLALAVAFCAALLVAVPAMATVLASQTIKTTVGMSEKYPAFHGKLHASNSYCISDRKVKLYREKGNGSGKLLGTATSESDGTWSIPIGNKLIGGAYYATVSAKSSTEVSLTCKAGKSQVAVVD